MDKIKVLENSLLKAIDALSESSDDKTTKMLADLFKSSVLEKYKDAYHHEFLQGKVHKENVEKAVGFYFADICVTLRKLPGLTDEEKENEIKVGKSLLVEIKQTVYNILASNNIEVIQ